MMKLLLLLMLIIGGTVLCSLGFELESLASENKSFGSQVAGKSNAGKKSYLGFEDHARRNHMKNMIGNFRSKHENIQTAASASNQNGDANFRYNHMIMSRSLLQGIPCSSIPANPSCSPPGGPS
ncbi:hypothetical protein MANES_10G110001v8 [Manihot esculenta]|uniref:Uncharacterized protein n=1 Tax=Manihot esculenta TaxID=3983 RepID=A0ACC8D2W6_MANES|nr:hypothetical protein MANES_10G110001v8 [Manihot esculenta]